MSEFEHLDQTKRDDLPPVPKGVADTLDDWNARMHGIFSGSHDAGLLLDLLADRGLRVVDGNRPHSVEPGGYRPLPDAGTGRAVLMIPLEVPQSGQPHRGHRPVRTPAR